MKTLHLVLGIFCAFCMVLDIIFEVHPLITFLAVVSTVINFMAYYY